MNELDAGTRAETVGSLLRSEEVLAAAMRSDPESQRIVQSAALDAIRVQEQAGVDVVTDGEVGRYSWAETPSYLDCFGRFEDKRGLDWRGGDSDAADKQPRMADVVVGKVAQAGRVGDRVAPYRFLIEHTSRRTKYTMAAPSYHRRYWSDEHSRGAYSNCEEFLLEVRDYLRELVAELRALGCDYIQLDAPNYGSLCDPDTRSRLTQAGIDVDEQLAFDAALDNSLFDGVTGVTRALHICRGNSAGGRWHSTGGYGAISGVLFGQLDFDRLLLEYDSDRAGTFEPLADIKPGVVAVLGLLTTKQGALEDEEQVVERITEASGIKPLEELAVSTQCGFASAAMGNPVTMAEQDQKLRLVTKVARRMWPESA